MKGDLWYLGQPYTHPDPEVQAARFLLGAKAAATLATAGVKLFVPITHAEQIHREGAGRLSWDYWMEVDLDILESDAVVGLIVLMLPGWEQSNGLALEIQLAQRLGKPIYYMQPSEILRGQEAARVLKLAA